MSSCNSCSKLHCRRARELTIDVVDVDHLASCITVHSRSSVRIESSRKAVSGSVPVSWWPRTREALKARNTCKSKKKSYWPLCPYTSIYPQLSLLWKEQFIDFQPERDRYNHFVAQGAIEFGMRTIYTQMLAQVVWIRRQWFLFLRL